MDAEIRVQIVNKRGLHARAAARLASTAATYQSRISVRRETGHADASANGKSIMGLMMLAAPQGSTLLIRAEGEDAKAALEALERLIAERFGEAE